MKTTFRSVCVLSAVAFVGALSACAGSAPPQASPGVTGVRGMGTATATVLHSVTHEPLVRMPVTVERVVKPESTAPIFWTDKNGRAEIRGLEDGTYQAFVFYNNVRSDAVRFWISGDYHPFITIYFNPDINNK